MTPFDIAIQILKPVWRAFWSWGWIIGPIAFGPVLWNSWVYYIRIRTLKKFKWQLLELKMPPDVEKTPLAMEQVFAVLHSSYYKGGWWKRNIEGRVQEWFSFEIVSFGGQLHFYIRTVDSFRNMVEAAVYSQYPQAELTEAEDYVYNVPVTVPNETHNLFGTEYFLAKEDAYPIRTYEDFEFGTEEGKGNVDPLAALTEAMSKMREGEQFWFQIGIRPADDGWKKVGDDLVNKLLGKAKPSQSGSYVWALLKKEIMDIFSGAAQILHKTPEYDEFKFDSAKDPNKPHSLMQYLSPLEKEVVEAIERNISKVGFETVIRTVYVAQKEVFNIPQFFAVVAALRQFNTMNMNSFKWDFTTLTAAKFPFKKRKEIFKKKWLLYKYRFRYRPAKMFVLNIEELATIFHIPGRIVASPTMPRIQAKKGEPPPGLPTY